MLFSILITAIYLWVICYFSQQMRTIVMKTTKKNNNILDNDIILKGLFSTKAHNYFITTLVISLFLLCAIWFYSLAGTDAVSSLLDIEPIVCRIIYFWILSLFIVITTISIFYYWVNIGVLGQILIINKEDIIGTCCMVNGLKIEQVDFRIKISEVTDIISLKGEKILGINLSTFNIITDTNQYQYLLLVDGNEIRRIIEKNKR